MSRVKPWEPQEGESPQAFEAFRLFRDAGLQRSKEAVARELGKNRSLIDRWAKRWAWGERVQLYDAEQDRIYQRQMLQARRDMAERHARIAMMVQDKIIRRLRSFSEEDVARLSPHQLSKFLEVSVKVERLARGEPTERMSTQDGGVDETPEQVDEIMSDPDARRLLDEAASRQESVEGHPGGNGHSPL